MVVPRRKSSSKKHRKLGHVSVSDDIVYRPLSEIRPAPENDSLYKPIDTTEPSFRDFLDKVRANGITDALIISEDGYICSGHRRFAAAEALGFEEVPCRTAAVRRDDPRFIPFLVACNGQRVKTLAEQLREEVVVSDPEEAYRALAEHRRECARVEADTITLHGQRRRCEITKAKGPFLDAICAVLAERREYWPLSDRQIHYALLNDPPLIHASKSRSTYRNDAKSYKALVELLTRARLAGRISFAAIADPTRPVTTWNVFAQPQPFIKREINGFLKGYYRDLMQSQPNHIEIIGEKNTVASIIRPVAMDYRIPFTIGRGYCSLPPRYEMAERFKASGKERLVLLVLSDFDPEGEDIAESFARSMRDDFDVETITPIKVALTAEQVHELRLPRGLKAKAGSSRRKGFVQRHGEHVYELEAVPPDDLQQILRDSIDGVIDIERFNAEVDREKEDAAYLDGVRRRVHTTLAPLLTDNAQ